MRRPAIIAAMLVLITVLAAPLVLAQQQNDVGFGEPKVGDNSLPPNATGVPSPDVDAASMDAPSPYIDTGFLQYSDLMATQQGGCGYDNVCLYQADIDYRSAPIEDDQSAP